VAEVLLFHHAQGLTSGCLDFADRLRRAGHVVHTPDLYQGRTFTDLTEGVGYAQETGFDTIIERGHLAAEGLPSAGVAAGALRSWSLESGPRRTAVVLRPPGVRVDLGGVAKGWLADRGLALLSSWPSAVLDADGDLSVRCRPGDTWAIAVDDPRTDGATLAILRLSAPAPGWPVRWGVATSGTSIHRWRRGEIVGHHLIDPRTGAPALTDVVQATVVCGSALRAEALAKAAVIAGTVDGLALLERVGVAGAVILTEGGETLALPQTLALLAE